MDSCALDRLANYFFLGATSAGWGSSFSTLTSSVDGGVCIWTWGFFSVILLLVLVSVLSYSLRLLNSVFLFYTCFFSFFSSCFSFCTRCLAFFFFIVCIEFSSFSLPFYLASTGFAVATYFCAFSFPFLFLSFCVFLALTDFLGKTFLVSIILVAWATFSLPFPPLGVESCRLVYVDFFFRDLLKNEVMASWLTSLSLGKGGNEDSSLSVAWLSSLTFAFSPCRGWYIFSTMGSTFCLSVSWVESTKVDGESIGYAVTFLAACCFFGTILPLVIILASNIMKRLDHYLLHLFMRTGKQWIITVQTNKKIE